MTREEAVKIVMSMLEKNVEGLKMAEDKMDQDLVDLGVDSLGIMVVMLDVSEATGIEISDDDADVLNSPEKIVDFITRK